MVERTAVYSCLEAELQQRGGVKKFEFDSEQIRRAAKIDELLRRKHPGSASELQALVKNEEDIPTLLSEWEYGRRYKVQYKLSVVGFGKSPQERDMHFEVISVRDREDNLALASYNIIYSESCLNAGISIYRRKMLRTFGREESSKRMKVCRRTLQVDAVESPFKKVCIRPLRWESQGQGKTFPGEKQQTIIKGLLELVV